jgi:hypothetical protein
MTDNTEFYELLNSLAQQQSFEVALSDGSSAKFKQLKTAQLKELVKTIVDSPLTQAVFSSTINKILASNLLSKTKSELNTVDRLLFILGARINTLSSKLILEKEKETINVDLSSIVAKLNEELKANKELLEDKISVEGDVEITYGIPNLESETKLVEEVYSKLKLNVDDVDELRKILGEAFINEIAKTVKTIKIQDKTLDFSTISFRSRIKTIESLPANLVNNVIQYIEKYKSLLDKCLTVENTVLPIDGSLFSSR